MTDITRERLREALKQNWDKPRHQMADAIADALGMPPEVHEDTPEERWARTFYDAEYEENTFMRRWDQLNEALRPFSVRAMRRVYHGIRAELLEEMHSKAVVEGLSFTKDLLYAWILTERRLAQGGEHA